MFVFSFAGSRLGARTLVKANQTAEVGEVVAENRQVFTVWWHDPDAVDAPVHAGRPLVRMHLVCDRREGTGSARESLGSR